MTKLKKSAVVIPALARIAVTAAASVSGTVAWFTANRVVSATAGTFTAYDDNGSLAITATAGKGTTVTNSKNVSVLGVLTDASFDFTNVWTDVRDADGNAPTAFMKVTDANYKTGSTNKANKEVYYAVDWTYTITLTSKTNDDNAVDLFFDLRSEFEGRAADDTSNGFRIAMVAGEGNNKQQLVWGVDETKTHVSAENNAQALFDANEYTQTVSTYSKRADGGADASNAKEYLGTFTPTSTSINITCTAWYEGTDSAVVSGNTRSSLSATRKFYARDAA